MSSSYHLPDPEHFTTGAVGPPGQRTFYLQVAEAGEVVSFKLEKQQVAALAEYLGNLLADLPEPPTAPLPAPPLVEPVEAAWTVGGIGLAVDEVDERIILVVHEFVPGGADEDEDDAADEVADLLAELTGLDVERVEHPTRGAPESDEDELDEDELDEDRLDDGGALARMRITLEQARSFIVRAGELMAASRPLCPFCGLPTDPDGHYCPREN